jgi:hypothetical protein
LGDGFIIRLYQSKDLEELRAIHRQQGFNYDFPNLEDPIFISKLVLENDGEIRAAIHLRLTSEAYAMLRPGGDPRERWVWFKSLHAASKAAAQRLGIEDVHAFLTLALEKSFRKRLGQLGWQQPTWSCYWLDLEENKNGQRG